MLSIGVFLKYPEPGNVKTRLAISVGEEAAARTYERMVRQVLALVDTLAKERFAPHLFYDPKHEAEAYRELGPIVQWPLHPQSEGGLGDRLKKASLELSISGFPFAFIGTDCVDMKPAHFEGTFGALKQGADLVLGPATDGGYYLIALKQPRSELFEGIAWSTDTVTSQTLEKAKVAGLRVHLLEELEDIDDKEALDRHPELLDY